MFYLAMKVFARTLLRVTVAIPPVNRAADLFGRVAQKIAGRFGLPYSIGLTRESCKLWAKVSHADKTRLVLKDGIFMKKNRCYAANPIPSYLPDGIELDFKNNTPENIARFFRQVRKLGLNYLQIQPNLSGYVGHITPVLITKSSQLKGSKEWLKEVTAWEQSVLQDISVFLQEIKQAKIPPNYWGSYLSLYLEALGKVMRETDDPSKIETLGKKIRQMAKTNLTKLYIIALFAGKKCDLKTLLEYIEQALKEKDKAYKQAYLEALHFAAKIEELKKWEQATNTLLTGFKAAFAGEYVESYTKLMAAVLKKHRDKFSLPEFSLWMSTIEKLFHYYHSISASVNLGVFEAVAIKFIGGSSNPTKFAKGVYHYFQKRQG